VCVKHGTKKKQCSREGCTNQAQIGEVCIRHGAINVDMNAPLRSAQILLQGGVCMKHGARVKQCSSDGCTNHARCGEVCIRHMGQRSNDAAMKDA